MGPFSEYRYGSVYRSCRKKLKIQNGFGLETRVSASFKNTNDSRWRVIAKIQKFPIALGYLHSENRGSVISILMLVRPSTVLITARWDYICYFKIKIWTKIWKLKILWNCFVFCDPEHQERTVRRFSVSKQQLRFVYLFSPRRCWGQVFCGLNFSLILILYTRGNLTRGWGLLVHFVSKWGSFSEYWHWSCSGQLSVAGYFINTASEIFKKNYNFRLVFWSPSILTRLQLVKIAVPAVAPALAV